uniref:Large ribosomal subunit protein mL44 n=1 Tax=Lygus hesperus TaxID=30085 RepID=A0A0A9YSG8_LYGHE
MIVARRLRCLIQSFPATGAVQGSQNFHRWVMPTLKTLNNRMKKMGPQDPAPRNTFAEWNYDAELYAFGQRLQENFDRDALKQALLDESFILEQELQQKEVGIEPGLEIQDNSKMSIEGDRLIQLYVEQYLCSTLPKLPKKYISNIKAHLVSDEMLAYIAKELGMGDLIQCADYPIKEAVLARSFKSVIQALAVSSGEDKACALIRDLVVAQLVGQDLTKFSMPDDPMEELKNHLRANGQEAPEPRLISVIGKNTILASYDVGIYSNKVMVGRGFGESAEMAQSMACCDALWRAWDVGPRRKPLPFKLELLPLAKFAASSPTTP